jgi:hypothetical protein
MKASQFRGFLHHLTRMLRLLQSQSRVLSTTHLLAGQVFSPGAGHNLALGCLRGCAMLSKVGSREDEVSCYVLLPVTAILVTAFLPKSSLTPCGSKPRIRVKAVFLIPCLSEDLTVIETFRYGVGSVNVSKSFLANI